jgi:hypothetical protein
MGEKHLIKAGSVAVILAVVATICILAYTVAPSDGDIGSVEQLNVCTPYNHATGSTLPFPKCEGEFLPNPSKTP